MTWIIGGALGLVGITALGMFVTAVRSAAVKRQKLRDAEQAVERMESAREVYDLDDVPDDRVGDFWSGMQDD